MDDANLSNVERLAQARSEREIVGVVRDYLGEWMPEDLAKLPPHCRPSKVSDGVDICGFAYTLARARFIAAGDETEARLAQLESFFAHACARVAHLMAAEEARQHGRETVNE
jgi:hypothetical protein